MKLYEDLDREADIKKKIRLNNGRIVKIFESKPEERRRTVRTRFRWVEDIEKDLWKMKVKRW